MRGDSPHLHILGVRVDRAGQQEAINKVSSYLKTPGCKLVVTLNPEHVMLAQDSGYFKRILNASDLIVPDGIGIVWASRLLGVPLKERVAGSDLLPHVCGLCAREDAGIFLLGGKPGVAGQAAGNLKRRFPGLLIAGTSSRDPGPEADGKIVEEINASGASVLAVAYGSPKENLWIERNRQHLETVRVVIGVGGALDFISGEMPRAPKILRQAGLEWLFRLYQEPSRVGRMLSLPRFGWRVIRERQESASKETGRI